MTRRTETLSTGELIDLAALGCLAERSRSPEAVLAFVRAAGGGAFSPTTEVVLERLGRLVEQGFVAALSAGRRCRLQVTESGRGQLVRLLRCEAEPTACALRAVCTTLKLCFLDLLPPDLRRDVARAMVAARERRLGDVRRADADWCRCPAIERCLARAAEREEVELDWLRRVLAGAIEGADTRS